MAQHQCAASASLAHLSTAMSAIQQPGCGAFLCGLHGPASQPATVTTPAHHCSRVLPAEELDADQRLQEAQDLVDDSYVLPESKFLPLPRQKHEYEGAACYIFDTTLACSYPRPQHDQGECSGSVILTALELALSGPFLWTLPQD